MPQAKTLSEKELKIVLATVAQGRHARRNRPPRQNSCRPDRIDEQGAMMEERIGSIRTGIQG